MTQAVIAGVGVALPDSSEEAPSRLATQAAVRAVADAGLDLADIDGLLTNGRQPTWPGDSRPVGLSLQRGVVCLIEANGDGLGHGHQDSRQ